MTQVAASPVVANRYDFVFLFDCKDGNPNGDPDMANTPRFDPETFQGIVTDVCLKRKIRDYVFAAKTQDGKPEAGYDIFVLGGHSLESRQRMPYDNLAELKDKARDKNTEHGDIERAREWMCQNFFDVRAFGAVMSTTKFRCGQVRGPAQLTFARSMHRVLSTEHGITRVAYTTEEKTRSTSAQTEMGNKHTIAYGLYLGHGFINPFLAEQTGFTEEDLAILWQALGQMFDLDRSAARGLMACRGMWVFRHDSRLGNASAHRLFELVKITAKKEPPREFSDYEIAAPSDGPVREFPGVSVKRLV
jgi:CRISPR-associated protein Csd2